MLIKSDILKLSFDYNDIVSTRSSLAWKAANSDGDSDIYVLEFIDANDDIISLLVNNDRKCMEEILFNSRLQRAELNIDKYVIEVTP